MARKDAAKPASSGVCAYCKQTFAKAGMTRHLQSCVARRAATEAELKTGGKKVQSLYHIQVTCDYAEEMWLHLEMPGSATLLDLDHFLRDIWLECCGHLSSFDINGADYESDSMIEKESLGPFGMALYGGLFHRRKTYSMSKTKLQAVLTEDLVFGHTYDFGSSTELKLKVMAIRSGLPQPKEPVRLLARNLMPEIKCQQCGKKPATIIDQEAMYDPDGKFLICKACARKRKLEDMILPLVNSPRAGICGYTGDAPDDWADFN
jgi:hypothetical protein